MPLVMGCGLVVAPAEQIKDPDTMRGLINQHNVVYLCMVPSQVQVCFAH
jgi:hypothetical protein